MPLYEVEHVIPLTSDQKDLLASAITTIHSQLFTTPSLFVNVRFANVANADTYIGGKRVGEKRSLSTVSAAYEMYHFFLIEHDSFLQLCRLLSQLTFISRYF